ncbi:hypothetical protein THIOM_004802 [Candidatus Thiomargarita nelsonii]|uniref:Uncharacterized protein n=1 Tax=Candidatus Thiomargarita nelsonii TaxID=1003181 RepID=A0A176RUZ1_9GAMM|nr:hypothetical protein THIOM_004802 [Candidatus Thiomargarita nelsonii]
MSFFESVSSLSNNSRACCSNGMTVFNSPRSKTTSISFNNLLSCCSVLLPCTFCFCKRFSSASQVLEKRLFKSLKKGNT